MVIRYLLLGGGGLSGFELLGIIQGLQWRGMANDIQHVASISIGTYFGAFFMMNTDSMLVQQCLSQCLDPQHLHISPFDIFRLPYKYHLINIEHFMLPLVKTMQAKWPDVRDVRAMSLREFCARCNRSWSIILTDLVNAKPVVASAAFMDVPVLELIHASMALPLILKPVSIKGHFYVDGGLTCDNPWFAFANGEHPPSDQSLQVVIHSATNSFKTPLKTIGHYLQSLTACGMWHKSAFSISCQADHVLVLADSVMPLLPLRITKKGLWIDITPEKIESAHINGLDIFEKWWTKTTLSSLQTP